MNRKKLTIPVGKDESVSAILTMPRNKILKTGVITAHGAGNDMENELLVAFTDGLANAGYPSLRFNFPYKEKGLKAPDGQRKLEDTWTAVYRYFQENSAVKVNHIIAAGKSMGGRVASQLIAGEKLAVDGLILLGYPLHPSGDQSKIRDAHLYKIGLPMLFLRAQGIACAIWKNCKMSCINYHRPGNWKSSKEVIIPFMFRDLWASKIPKSTTEL